MAENLVTFQDINNTIQNILFFLQKNIILFKQTSMQLCNVLSEETSFWTPPYTIVIKPNFLQGQKWTIYGLSMSLK